MRDGFIKATEIIDSTLGLRAIINDAARNNPAITSISDINIDGEFTVVGDNIESMGTIFIQESDGSPRICLPAGYVLVEEPGAEL